MCKGSREIYTRRKELVQENTRTKEKMVCKKKRRREDNVIEKDRKIKTRGVSEKEKAIYDAVYLSVLPFVSTYPYV
jgi:hypothetical protein